MNERTEKRVNEGNNKHRNQGLNEWMNGMEWNGMEWNGMEWNGMEWNGMEWNGMEWNGMEWNEWMNERPHEHKMMIEQIEDKNRGERQKTYKILNENLRANVNK